MSNNAQMKTVAGLATARGFASGPVFLYRGDADLVVPEYKVESGREGDEFLRLKRAKYECKRDLEHLINVLKERTGRSDVRVFECHLMILEDAALGAETEKHIIEDHLNAEAAVRKTADGARALFGRMNDPYFRERVRDLDDVERRLLKSLMGFSASPSLELHQKAIIVADDLTPSETVQMPREYVLGFATNGGSTSSHAALLARALGIPAVTGLGNITDLVHPGENILLDGTNGTVSINPDAETVAHYEGLIQRQRELVDALHDGEIAGRLKDGEIVHIYANVHPGIPVAGIKELGARGVGLYRSEYLWLNKGTEPDEEEQFAAYLDAVKFSLTLSETASITIRTLDIGGDKTVSGISQKEANPFLGNRSIRYLLANKSIFKTQLRAILRAAYYGNCYMMYPMVSCVEELKEAAVVLDEVKKELESERIPYKKDIPVGAMIEVPSAALLADSLAKYVDFFSIGTNDLIQYVMAADRGNDAVSHLYQPTNPAIIKLMRLIVDAAKRNSIKVGVCGESASDPIVGVLWAAFGIDMLSMSATYIPVMAKLFAELTRDDLKEYMHLAESLSTELSGKEIYDLLYAWMKKKIPRLEEILI